MWTTFSNQGITMESQLIDFDNMTLENNTERANN